mgnify:FL=1
MVYRYLLLVLLIGFSQSILAQNSRLANEYYRSGEYEKAAQIYLQLFEKTGKNDYYFGQYIESLLAIENYDEAEDAIKKQIKIRPKDIQLYVTYGNLFEKQYEPEKAEKQYKRAIENMPPDIGSISKIGSAFTRLSKYDLAIETYEKGEELVDRDNVFAPNLAELYRRKGNSSKMIENYLNSLDRYQNNINSLITTLQRSLTDEDYEELQTQLYAKIQEEDVSDAAYEILEWTFIYRKEFKRAFRQARSLDRKNEENGY